ncbi:UNVERIFIED_CONTAM: hypothetical protein GTU68_015700 [Idotea baltica]|nr:hypothetical protein [Idotea baltica]
MFPRSLFSAAVCVVVLLCCTAESIAVGPANQAPNIIVILADDMGYSDIGCYGSEIQTPVLDSLADSGLRYTQFYNTARCCPTRASLLSGLYPHQAGIGHMMSDSGHDGYRGELNRQCVTIAEALKPAGYGTYMAGKWHVTQQVKFDGDKSNWPRQRGFDRFYGTIHGAGSFFDPNSLTRENTQITPLSDPDYQPETFYYTDAISDNAVRFMNDHVEANPQKPFFMYVAYTAAHWPMHALPEDIEKYSGIYDEGYAAFRKSRLEKMKQLGVVSADSVLSEQAEDWDKVTNKAWEARCMEVYAAMVDRMDQGIGKIVRNLKATGQYDNTLILFMQDNGGCAEGMGRKAKGGNGERRDQPEAPMGKNELQVDMIPKKTRDGWPLLQGDKVMPGPADTYIGYGRGWANVSNTPFREYKHWVHEGGISTPLIAHWPAGIARKGELESTPGHLIDIMATCVDVAKAHYPAEKDGHKIKPMEGKSLKATFAGGSIDREAIYFEHEGNRAIRAGDWKLVAKSNTGPWELYNIALDRSEQNNLAADEPARVRVLTAMWQAYAERANVLPLTPYYKKKSDSNSKKTSFQLKAGDKLNRENAPAVAGKSFRLNVQLAKAGTGGVILAHGGSNHGYGLHQDGDRMVFSMRRAGKLSTCDAGGDDLGNNFVVILKTDGHVEWKSKGQSVGNGKVEGPLKSMPAEGVQVGLDLEGLVGDYSDDHAFDGTIEKITLKIQ